MTALFVDRSTSSYDWEFRYTGRREDIETELMFFRARYFHPQFGEFISRDPLGFVDGMSLYRGYFVPGAIDPLGIDKQEVFAPTVAPPILPLAKVQDIEVVLPKLCDVCHEKPCPSFNGCDPVTCRDEATRIAQAIKNTFGWRVNSRDQLFRGFQCVGREFWGPYFGREQFDDERCRGFYCYEWAYGFRDALELEAGGKCFSAVLESSDNGPPDFYTHAWIKISLSCGGKSIYVDDGFRLPGICHLRPPRGRFRIQPGFATPRDDIKNPVVPYDHDGWAWGR